MAGTRSPPATYFRRVKGYRQLPDLAALLEAVPAADPTCSTRLSEADAMINSSRHRHRICTQDVTPIHPFIKQIASHTTILAATSLESGLST